MLPEVTAIARAVLQTETAPAVTVPAEVIPLPLLPAVHRDREPFRKAIPRDHSNIKLP